MYKYRNLFIASAMMVAAAMPLASNAEQFAEGEATPVVANDTKKEKTLNQGEFVTIYMGREARNITIDWGEGTNCEFDVQISCGHGCFVSVYEGKAKGKGAQTYSYIRTSVEELRIIITKGKGSIRNMQTISTKADDNETYNPV